MVELFANSGDQNQMPHSAASDLGLHCLPITLLGVSRLQWVNWKVLLFFLYLQENICFCGEIRKKYLRGSTLI